MWGRKKKSNNEGLNDGGYVADGETVGSLKKRRKTRHSLGFRKNHNNNKKVMMVLEPTIPEHEEVAQKEEEPVEKENVDGNNDKSQPSPTPKLNKPLLTRNSLPLSSRRKMTAASVVSNPLGAFDDTASAAYSEALIHRRDDFTVGSINYAFSDTFYTMGEMVGLHRNSSATTTDMGASVCTVVDWAFFQESMAEFFCGVPTEEQEQWTSMGPKDNGGDENQSVATSPTNASPSLVILSQHPHAVSSEVLSSAVSVGAY
eukprot:CAMPEP_0172446738 /NCGR_PEP_ID=MMETSP1065-20121228/6272_1 /TAXON_ID=265537 /ORGANISM="Amphiprora paludosa, Strain CCMP125" /LENGTH=258 /DNA_ID=CAMNT_0013197927 /DNA_START=62 /DNA_END=838 /DNA_ORIENTATION=+